VQLVSRGDQDLAAHQIDPGDHLGDGVFELQPTPAQQAALGRLETALALVEGWVDSVVDAAARGPLTSAPALRETTGIDLGLWREGIASVAANEAEAAQLRSRCAWQRQHGHLADWLDADEVQARWPWLGPTAGALWADDASGTIVADTGASLIALNEKSAAQFGLRPSRGDYNATVSTANGTIKAARTRLFDVLTHFDLPKKHGHRPPERLVGDALELGARQRTPYPA